MDHSKPLPETLDAAVADLESSVYQGSRLLEDLERAGSVFGNGHHLRQQVAAYAAQLLRERWQEPKPTKKTG